MLTTLAAALLSAVPAPQTTPIVDTDRTMADQPLAVPSGPLRIVATRIVLPAGSTIGTHMHLWARYVYIESGEVQLILAGTGETRTYKAGEMIVEPLGKWHSGKIVRDTVLVATEQVPPGRCNTVRPPTAGASNDC
jgi:quercetin dioxygenase-like cupin family protein